MNRAMRLLLGAASLTVLASCATGPSPFGACRFEAPEPRTTQGLQHVASDRGLGGSGISTDERGLGGSGIRSGIIGVVTGFASLCVNGYEVELDERSVVTIEGHPATAADIHLGQLVVIEAEQDRGQLRAASVDVRLAAMGPVTSISDDGKTMTLLGQTVRLADLPGARLEKVTPGDWVAVSGLRGADTVIEGTSVVRLPEPGARAMVAGVVREGRAANFEVGALPIHRPGVTAGDAVVVEVRPQNGALTVANVRPQLDARFTAGVRDLSLQTLVPSDRLMGLRISPTEMRPMTPGGSPIQMEGRLARGNTFVLDRVLIPSLPRDGQNAVRNIIVDRGILLKDIRPGDVIPALVPPNVPVEVRPEIPTPPAPSPP